MECTFTVPALPDTVRLTAPEVESALVEFRRSRDLMLTRPQREKLRGIVNSAFAQRRKQLGKVLGGVYGKKEAAAALTAEPVPRMRK